MSSTKKEKKLPTRIMIRNTIDVKKRIVEMYECGMRIRDVAAAFCMPRSTISSIVKNKEAIKAANVAKGVKSLTKLRSPNLERVENLLLIWIKEQRRSGTALTETMICDTAKAIHADLLKHQSGTSQENEVFKASHGWYDNFKKRAALHELLGKLPRLDVDLDNKLVAAVKQNKCLYDHDDPGHGDEQLKESIWQNIAKSLGVTVEKVKTRWQSLETLYIKSLKSVNKVHLFSKMAFLRPHVNQDSDDQQLLSTDKSSVSIKSEMMSSEEEFVDTVDATPSIAADVYSRSKIPLVTYECGTREEVELEMKVDEVEEPSSGGGLNTEPRASPLDEAHPVQPSLATTKASSASSVRKRKLKKFVKPELSKTDPDLEYFKGFLSLIKELSSKRKRQLFSTFSQELFRHLEEQEKEETSSTDW